MNEGIPELRQKIDVLNLQLLELLSERARLAEAIGELQSRQGLSHYDPVREQQMLQALSKANTGPFENATVHSLFKQIFQASMHLEQQQDKKRYLTSREVHADDTVVSVGDLSIGSDHSPVLIAGPCAIESAEQVEATASFLAQRGVRLFRGGAFKPRTDPYSFQGLGVEGLKIAREACDRHDLLFVSEIMDARDLPAFQEYADPLPAPRPT